MSDVEEPAVVEGDETVPAAGGMPGYEDYNADVDEGDLPEMTTRERDLRSPTGEPLVVAGEDPDDALDADDSDADDEPE